MVSLWGHTPFYVRAGANPKVCRTIVAALNLLLDIKVDLKDLDKAAKQMDAALERLMGQNQNLRSHVQRLEQQHDATTPSQMPLEGADQVIKDVEEFLRNEQRKDKEIDTS